MPLILVVEDDADLRCLAAAWIDQGSEVRTFASPQDVTDEDILWCDAVVSDYRMVGGSGCDLLKRVRQVDPTVRRILWSASPPVPPCPDADVTLTKPNTAEQIRAAVNG